MGRRLEVEISQSQEELEKALKTARTASSKERLLLLYLLKSKQVSRRQELAFPDRTRQGNDYKVD